MSETFTATGIIETETITDSGFYEIIADGAAGGADVAGAGGLGADARGLFYLSAGTVLDILAGEAGDEGDTAGGGGGGGSYVIEQAGGSLVPLVVAGGGGGGSLNANGAGALAGVPRATAAAVATTAAAAAAAAA